MRLFTVNKIPVSLEKVTHESELRRGENRVKIAVLHCKVALTRKHAAAMPDGVLRRLYGTSTGDDVDAMTLRLDFASLCDRQILTVAAAPDVDETKALDQVRIFGVHARRTSTENMFTLQFKASFGPLSSKEWEFIDLWRTTQRFVTFKDAQASLEFLPAKDESADDEAEEAERKKSPALPLEGTCTHGVRVGEVCEDCPDQVAVVVEPARILPLRNQKKNRGAAGGRTTH